MKSQGVITGSKTARTEQKTIQKAKGVIERAVARGRRRQSFLAGGRNGTQRGGWDEI